MLGVTKNGAKPARTDSWTTAGGMEHANLVMRNSGMSVRKWCQENGISEKTYYYWQRRVFKALAAQRETCFAEFTMASRPSTPEIMATLRLGSMEADIYTGADTAAIETLCRALKSC